MTIYDCIRNKCKACKYNKICSEELKLIEMHWDSCHYKDRYIKEGEKKDVCAK